MAKDRTLGLKLKAVDRISNTLDRVNNKFPKLTRSIHKASAVAKIFNHQTKQMRQTLTKVGGSLKSFGRTATLGVTLPLLAMGGAGVKAFGDFEQGMKGVEKTTGITGPALQKLGENFDKLSTEIPVSTAEMLELAQAGGQLGIKGAKNIEKFTLVMAKLSRASDVAGEDGAKSIARILEVTGSGIGKVDNFAAALVDLGNNAAASESEILEVSNRVAGAIGRFDVGAEKVLGISTALKALGKNAESAGSVVGLSFDAIDQSIKGGGKELSLLSKLTGIATQDMKKAFAQDAAAVFEKFVGGLSKVQSGGGNMIKVMGALGLSGVRVNDILGTLAKRPKVLSDNLERSAKAFAANVALQNEFEVQTSSFNSEMQVLANTFTSLLRIIGKELAPAVRFFGKILKGVFDFLRNNPTIRTLVIVFGAFAAVMGPVIFAVGALVAILPALLTGLAALGIASFSAFAPFLIGAAAIAAVIAVVVLLVKKWDMLVTAFGGNPFFSIIKTLFSFLTPLGLVITGVRALVAAFSGFDAVKDVFRDVLPKFAADAILGEKTLGPAKGAFSNTGGAPLAPQSSNVNGNIGVTFANAPAGTKIKSNFEGPLGFDLGFAGGGI